ncbi:uncharacterized protein VTP21DRAFT_11466 [Calcarisporiella thermophila]|uniref:uncharacterized protein n=1 Tax=Calcarisporiella thermophila TaxID=911321 RepID=UPI0037444E3F
MSYSPYRDSGLRRGVIPPPQPQLHPRHTSRHPRAQANPAEPFQRRAYEDHRSLPTRYRQSIPSNHHQSRSQHVQFNRSAANPQRPAARQTSAAAATHIQRHRSLTRPERQRARVPMLGENVHSPGPPYKSPAAPAKQPMVGGGDDGGGGCKFKPWTWLSWAVTCCVPGILLKWCGKKDPLMQQAWREKVTLCIIILFFCGLLGFLTFALQPALCPQQRVSYSYTQQMPDGSLYKVWRENVTVYGELYGFEDMRNFLAQFEIDLVNDYKGVDLSGLFDGTKGACAKFDRNQKIAPPLDRNCIVYSPYGGWVQQPSGECIPLWMLTSSSGSLKPLGSLYFEWTNLRPNNVEPEPALIVLNNNIMNMTSYIMRNDPYMGPDVHSIILSSLSKDATARFSSHWDSKEAMRCIQARYAVGTLSRDTIGCFAANIIMNVSLAVIVALIVVRFVMAFVFRWCISLRLVKPSGRQRASRTSRREFMNRSGSASSMLGRAALNKHYGLSSAETGNEAVTIGNGDEDDVYTVMLVTCYSEGEAGLRTTFDSLAATTYSERHKMFFIVCDGLITGSGNERSTPDMVVSMLTLEEEMKDPKSCSYIAIADGERQLNMAKVYAGHYVYSNAWIPTIVVVKCGTPAEASQPKPGNRGKRDSQVILMSFFQRVLFNDRLTELDYELFWKIQWVMEGVTPDKFELVLMVDADTKVAPDSLSHMVSAMVNDVTIMGLCGETRIANKKQSWVTMIQVFEYYINHHYHKAFESTFGGVTCLPGCFCMYRIKAPKNGAWVPILANPDILLEYNQNVVNTLHEKNLLLLGEDRFLSTLMLRTFPKRQMMFVPQAVCKTVVPDTFGVLLSQRRRWINSTIHNLMELVLVSDLCGIACLSMQFAVFVELMGTVVLPAAICFTGWLIVSSFLGTPQIIPLLLLAAILGLPAVLIVVTTRKIVYVGWMVVYLLALPIWNCVLPTYAYWHFDDFSWGQTRKVAGDSGKDDHGAKEGEFDSSMIVMRKWEEWERERRGLKKLPRVMPSPAGLGDDDAGGLMTPDRISLIHGANEMVHSMGDRHSRMFAGQNAGVYYTMGPRTSSYYSPRHPMNNPVFPTSRPVIPTPSGRMSWMYSPGSALSLSAMANTGGGNGYAQRTSGSDYSGWQNETDSIHAERRPARERERERGQEEAPGLGRKDSTSTLT